MKERPILFSAEMVRAILAGRKTQTRWIITTKWMHGPDAQGYPKGDDVTRFAPETGHSTEVCPYRNVGDLLWVRETWCSPSKNVVGYKADAECGAWMDGGAGGRIWIHHGLILESPAYNSRFKNDERWTTYGIAKYGGRWRPAIYMPRWMSRITLEITGVKVERLNSISTQDAIAEGIDSDGGDDEHRNRSTVENFRVLWESINGKGSWAKNPWVWAISFQQVPPSPSPAMEERHEEKKGGGE